VIITVTVVRVVEAAIDEVVGVLAVRNGLVAAVRSVNMLTAVVRLIAGVGELVIDRQRVLINVITVRLVQVAIVNEVDVAFVDDRRVAAAGAVDVVVIFVSVPLGSHRINLPRWPNGRIDGRFGEPTLMGLRQLRSALHAFTQEAAWQLASDAQGGHELPFEVVEEGRRDSPLYCYRPMTADFINERSSVLARLPTFLPAAHALIAIGSLADYLDSQGVRPPGPGRQSADAALHCFLARVFVDSNDFVFDERCFDKAYLELERCVAEERAEHTVVAVLLGVELGSEEVSLGDGLTLARGERFEDAPDEARWSRLDGSPQTLVIVRRSPVPGDVGPLQASRTSLRKLAAGLSLYHPDPVAIAPLGWSRIGAGPWQPVAINADAAEVEPLVLIEPAQEDELRAFLSLVGRREPKSGELAWALRRYEMAHQRVFAAEALTDLLLVARALLEPEGPASGRMSGRLAALCAEPENRAAMTERIAHAAALEPALIAGVDRELKLQPYVSELDGHLRALLRDACCGHLSGDLVGLADSILLEDGAPEAAPEQPFEAIPEPPSGPETDQFESLRPPF
jgi:hypothetical protein